MLSVAAVVGCSKGYIEPDSSIMLKTFAVHDGIDDIDGVGNNDPVYVTTREFWGLMDISQGNLSHKWEFFEVDNGITTWQEDTDLDMDDYRYIDDFDVQIIRENSGIPSTVIDDFEPTDYTYNPAITPTTTIESLLAYYETPGMYKLRITNTYDEAIYYDEPRNNVTDLPLGGAFPRYAQYVSNGVYEVVYDYNMHVHMKLEGACNIYTDAAYSNLIDLEFDFREEENYEVYTIPQGATLYFEEVSGTTTYDEVNQTTWVAEYYSYGGNSAEPTSLPIVASASTVKTAVTFDQAGAFRMVLWQKYTTPDNIIDVGNFPSDLCVNPIPIIFNVE